MGRTLMYASITALAALVFSATFLLKHGGESVAMAEHVSVHDLTSGPNHFAGRTVTTVGVIGFSEEHDRFQLVAEANFAIIIREYVGDDSLDGLRGREVRVRGVFGIDRESGVYIDASYIGPVAD